MPKILNIGPPPLPPIRLLNPRRWLGGWPKILRYFSSIYLRQLILLQIYGISCQFREFLSLFNIQQHFFHQNERIKISWRAINNNHLPLHMEVQNYNCFSTKLGGFDYFKAKMHLNSGNEVYDCVIKLKLGYFEVTCCCQKSQFAAIWHSEILATLIKRRDFKAVNLLRNT